MKSFVQYGAGNIGRGFIGQLFSDAGYFVQFIDVDPQLINSLNQYNRYPVTIVSNDSRNEVWVEHVACINAMETETAAEAIANCDLMATAVGVNVLPRIVPNLVAGFRKRLENGNNKPLNIIICENLIDADKLLYQLIAEQLNEDEIVVFDERVGLVEASVGRMVPVMTDEQKQDNPLRVCVESFCELPVNKAAFKGEIPNLPGLLPFAPFEFYIKRKLFIHNMGHALAAYLGYLAGYEYIWQAISNPVIRTIAKKAMNESALALSKRFNMPLNTLIVHIHNLLERFGNVALGDTVARVGRDTKRKLSANDRFTGAVAFCAEQGIEPVYIPLGIAAGLLFQNSDDPGTQEVHNLLNSDGPDTVLDKICGLKGDKDYIKDCYLRLKSDGNLNNLIEKAEEYKRKTGVFI